VTSCVNNTHYQGGVKVAPGGTHHVAIGHLMRCFAQVRWIRDGPGHRAARLNWGEHMADFDFDTALHALSRPIDIPVLWRMLRPPQTAMPPARAS